MTPYSGAATRGINEYVSIKGGVDLDVQTDFRAKGDGKELHDGAIAAASDTFSSASSTFTSYYVGKMIFVSGAGAGGAVLVTTIAAVIDVNTLTLFDTASTTVTGTHAMYGTDDAPAIRTALATVRSIFIPKQKLGDFYMLASYDPAAWLNNAVMAYLAGGTDLYGEEGTTLKVADGVLYATDPTDAPQGGLIFFGDLASRVWVHDMTIDMNGPYNLTPPGGLFLNWCIAFEGGTFNTVERVAIIDSPGRNCIITQGIPFRPSPASYFTVIDCVMRNGGTSVPGNIHQPDFSALYSTATYTVFERNTVTHDVMPMAKAGGMEIHGSESRATNNNLNFCFPGLYLEGDIPDTPLVNVLIEGNIFNNCLIGIELFPFSVPGVRFGKITIRGNIAHLLEWDTVPQAPWFLSQPRDDTGHFTSDGLPLGSGNFLIDYLLFDSEISHNVVTDETPTPQASAFARISATRDVQFTSNVLKRFGGPAYQIIGSPIGHTSLVIDGDSITDFGLNTGSFSHHAILVGLNGSSINPAKAAYDLDGLTIRNITLSMTSPSSTATAIWWQWDSGSVVQRIKVCPFTRRNVNGSLFDGPNWHDVDYEQTDKAPVLYDASTNTHRQTTNVTWDEIANRLRFLQPNPLLDLFSNFGRGGIVQATGNPDVSPWTATTFVGPTGGMRPTVPNGYYYYTLGGGTTGSAQPTWPVTPGSTVIDGSVTWICSSTGTTPPAGYGQWICFNCYFDGANWRQPVGSFPSFAMGPNLHLNFAFMHGPAIGTDNGVVMMTLVAQIDALGNYNSPGLTQPVIIKTGWGITPGAFAWLAIGAGGTSGHDSISFCWGDGTGYKMQFGYQSGAAFVPKTAIYDDGSIDPLIIRGVATGHLLKWDGTKVVDGGSAAGTGTHVVAASTALIILTTSYVDVPGLTVTLTKTGWWRVEVSLMCSIDWHDGSNVARLVVGGTPDARLMEMFTSVGNDVIYLQEACFWWVQSTTGSEVCKIQARKILGSGSSAVGTAGTAGGQSVIDATWVHS